MKKIFTAEEKDELLNRVNEIAGLVHESGLKVAKNMNLPDEFIVYMKSTTLSTAEDLKCTCPKCNPEGDVS